MAQGFKGLVRRAVEILRLPPKPLLIPLTGGYPRAPVIQIGTHFLCLQAVFVKPRPKQFELLCKGFNISRIQAVEHRK